MTKKNEQTLYRIKLKLEVYERRQKLLDYCKQGLITAEEMARLAVDERYVGGLKPLEEAY